MAEENRYINSRVYTTHGKKRNQGKLAIVNDQVALCYTEGENEEVVAYTPLTDMLQKSCGMVLPRYQLDF